MQNSWARQVQWNIWVSCCALISVRDIDKINWKAQSATPRVLSEIERTMHVGVGGIIVEGRFLHDTIIPPGLRTFRASSRDYGHCIRGYSGKFVRPNPEFHILSVIIRLAMEWNLPHKFSIFLVQFVHFNIISWFFKNSENVREIAQLCTERPRKIAKWVEESTVGQNTKSQGA